MISEIANGCARNVEIESDTARADCNRKFFGRDTEIIRRDRNFGRILNREFVIGLGMGAGH